MSSEIAFIEAEANDAVKRENYQKGLFTFSIDNYQYTVDSAGHLTVKLPGRGPVQKTTLDFPDPPLVTSIRYCLYQGDLIINYNFLLDVLIQQGNDLVKGKIEQGRISRLNRYTLEAKWTIINAISDPPGVPHIVDESIYVTSAGVIGEVDLGTGSYLWRHKDLTQKNGTRLFVFKVPRVEGNYVFFEEESFPELRRPPYTVQVKRRTGEIITMDYKPSGK